MCTVCNMKRKPNKVMGGQLENLIKRWVRLCTTPEATLPVVVVIELWCGQKGELIHARTSLCFCKWWTLDSGDSPCIRSNANLQHSQTVKS